LSTGSINDAGEGDDVAATIVASGGLGAKPAVAHDGARSRKTVFVLIVGALAIGLAGLGIVLRRRGLLRSSHAVAINGALGPDDDDPAGREAAGPWASAAPPGAGPAGQGALVSQGHPVPGRPVVCPSCRKEFPPGSIFCPNDGNRLVGSPLAPLGSPA